MLLVGDTVILDEVPPVFQLYVLAPLAVSVELLPEHIVAGEADADILNVPQLHHILFH